jgi:hypothetical protein
MDNAGFSDWIHARRHHTGAVSLVHLNNAQAATTQAGQGLVVAQRRNPDARPLCRVQYEFAAFHGSLFVVYCYVYHNTTSIALK